MNGLVHIYTGNGKGKTSAAIGLGIRACGRGLKVFMAQFLKGMETGEITTLKKLEPDFILYRSASTNKFTWDMDAAELVKAREAQQSVFNYALEAAKSGKWDLIILDEIMAAISAGFVSLEDVKDFIRNKPGMLEVVMTGRNAPQELIELADYVSEINEIKHPMKNGIPARKGIEF